MTRVKLITANLLNEIEESIQQASTIYILSSFVMKSGVKLLKDSLYKAAERGADIKILTGDYLYITQVEALTELASIHEFIRIRLFQSNGVSFHAKAYMFHHEENGTVYIGSSNMSNSAFTSGIEWNIGVSESDELYTIEEAMNHFMELFHQEQTVPINPETIKIYEEKHLEFHKKYPELQKKWTSHEEKSMMFPENKRVEIDIVKDPSDSYTVDKVEITPRPAQQAALAALEATLEEDYQKAMVVMATGLGKTYLAAFFARKFKRTLFIAHREEILNQAMHSFQVVLQERSLGLYYGKEKVGDAEVIFGSVNTMGMKHHYEKFNHKYFDLIIIDEFHHAAANSYQKIIEYFEPNFLLGITATPDRMDGKDVYAICDGNVAYQMHFIEAINNKWLAPFKYYGFYDETDYSQITWLGTKYASNELLEVQLKEDIAQKIVEAWEKHRQTRTLVFCSSIEQARFLSNYFNQKGYNTIDLHSQQTGITRSKAIQMLEERMLDAIFTVDLFNEGVDIPSVDTLLFVRPTESLTVFTQQVGRGLRLADDKDYCVIIDLIGNYRNADIKLSLFNSESEKVKNNKKDIIPAVPIGCELHLELRVINLIKELARKRQPRKERIYSGYLEIKQELGRRPSYLELHLMANINVAEIKQEWGSYAGFLDWVDELDSEERLVYRKHEEWFRFIERTSMSRSYKMVVLNYMLSKEQHKWYAPITPEEAALFFADFYQSKKHRFNIEFAKEKDKGQWINEPKKVAKKIAEMPMMKLSESSKGLISFKNNVFRLEFEVEKGEEQYLYAFTNDICEYRLHEYFEKKANL